MVAHILTLLILLAVYAVSAQDSFKKPGTPGMPSSMAGDGLDATQIYLERHDLYQNSKDGTRGHFYATFKIGSKLAYNSGEEFKLQISTVSLATGVVGKACTDCDVDKKIDASNWSSQGVTTSSVSMGVKNMDAATDTKKHQGGFKYTTLKGTQKVGDIFYVNKWNDKKHLELKSFNMDILESLKTPEKDPKYASNQSGVLGLGLPTALGDFFMGQSIIPKWKSSGVISKQIISYNITFKPETWESLEDSYIQIGPVDSFVTRNATWIPTADWKRWGADVSLSYFRKGEQTFPFLEYQAKAVFDPSVDYLYVNGLEFENLITPVLKSMYGDDIGCTQTDCFFVRTCEEVKKQYSHTSLNFNIGKEGSLEDQIEINLDIEKYLVRGSELGVTDDKCFLPIFVVNPGESTTAFTTWFLGNMFLDRYYVIHDYENSDKKTGKMPMIGVYDKWDPLNDAWAPGAGNNVDPTQGGNSGNDPVIPVPGGDEEGGIGTFWTLFLILFFLGVVGVLIKFFGKQCVEKVQDMTGGGGQFKTGQYDASSESDDTAGMKKLIV